MGQATSVIAICENHERAEQATQQLEMAGVDMLTVSTATKDVYVNTDEAVFYRIGAQTFVVPGIGPVLAAGPLAAWIATELERAAAGKGVSVVGAGLAGIGVARESILQYETALKAGKCILVVHGSPNDILLARKIIGGTTHCSHTIHGEKSFDTVHGATLPGVFAYPYQA